MKFCSTGSIKEWITWFKGWIISYNSLDCHVKLCWHLYCDSKIANKITCGHTKVAAITRNVLAPYSQEKVSSALKGSLFLGIWY